MKLTSKFWIFLGIGILVVVLISLGVLYLRQQREYDELSKKLSAGRDSLPVLISTSQDLEVQLSQTKTKLNQTKLTLNEAGSKFAEHVESIEYGEIFFKMADGHHLILKGFSSTEPKATKIQDVTFLTASFTLTLEGEEWNLERAGNYDTYVYQTTNDILEFVHELAISDYFAGARIDNVNVTRAEGSVITQENYPRPLATVNITINSYQDK